MRHYSGIYLQELETPKRSQVRMVGILTRLELGTSQIRVRKVTTTANMLSDIDTAAKV
jgi:hypothetical protein